MNCNFFSASEVSVPVGAVRAAAVEPERLVPVKPEVQVGPEQQNHDPRAQRSYVEELRRDPVLDKYVYNSHLVFCCCFFSWIWFSMCPSKFN